MGESNSLIVSKHFPFHQSPPRSLTVVAAIFSRKSFFYHKLRSEPLRLSVLKLDGSCFDIEVAKTATVAELKDSVEAVFSHMPQKGPAKISWPHVWAQFCLCYDGQKLVTEEDYLRNYGIKDGDQLRFIRHSSNSYTVQRKRMKKRVILLKQRRSFFFEQLGKDFMLVDMVLFSNKSLALLDDINGRCRSSSRVNSCKSKEDSDDGEEICSGDIAAESGIQHYNEDRVGKKKLTDLMGVLFSYTRLAVVRQTRIKSKMFCPSTIARCLLGSFGKIRRIVSFGRRRHHFRKHSWRRY
ncbi:hypothetical protein RIF29_27200 [Crotalaria pallida]|uniref:SNRNP25 ubiquitin-like domain-containing protein n=1 Tax=Crotalaria pallida TaxID=3830 RepID=A0AAN9EPA2_CROPI